MTRSIDRQTMLYKRASVAESADFVAEYIILICTGLHKKIPNLTIYILYVYSVRVYYSVLPIKLFSLIYRVPDYIKTCTSLWIITRVCMMHVNRFCSAYIIL